MKKLTKAVLLMFALSTVAMGCASKGETKDDAAATESSREIQPAASGGMQRMEEEEEAVAPAEEAAPEEGDGLGDEEAPAPEE